MSRQVKARKIPQRTCVGCRRVRPKSELIRIVRNQSNEVFIDLTSKANGRGAYICPDLICLRSAMKRNALNNVFDTDISKEQVQLISEQLDKIIKQRRQLEEAITS